MTKQISKKTKIFNPNVVIIGIVIIIAVIGIKILGDESNSSVYNETASVIISDFLDTQTNEEDNISITATPIDQLNWGFKIILSTHSGDLSEDLTQVSVLVDENDNEYKPIEWKGDPLGGHHREGILNFGKIVPQPKSITLFIRKVGSVEERKFEWIIKP